MIAQYWQVTTLVPFVRDDFQRRRVTLAIEGDIQRNSLRALKRAEARDMVRDGMSGVVTLFGGQRPAALTNTLANLGLIGHAMTATVKQLTW